jgi:glucokinase
MIYKLLLIDIGGTNMRHAITSSDSNDITNICKTAFTDMGEFEEKLKDLIDKYSIDILIASVAGPKVNNSISMTNRNYEFDADEISEKFNLKDCYLLNDWEAIAHSYDYIKDSIEQIKEGASFNKNTLYLGPGTGLGAAISIDNKTVLSTEIGNTTNSTKYLMENYNIESEDLLTLEDVISGTAISSIYKLKTGLSISSEEILEKYQEEEPISVEVINNFIKSLALLLSDLALTFNTGNGILLAGSLMRSLYPLIDKDNFYKLFVNNKKETHINMLDLVSIGVITKKRTPLYGNLNFYKKLKK